MDPDIELLERWSSGDAHAGNELVSRHFDSLYHFFENKVGGDCDDLIQATFLSCVQGRERFRQQSSFRTYLFAIARNQLYQHLRTRYRHLGDIDVDRSSFQDLATSPTGRIARAEEHKLLLHALRTLPIEQQVLLELHYWEEMGAEDLAQVFGVAVTAVRMRLTRARQALHARMQTMAESPLPAHASVEDLDAWARGVRAGGPRDAEE